MTSDLKDLVKKSIGELKDSGGFRQIPVTDVIGDLDNWDVPALTGNQTRANVVFSLKNIEVKKTRPGETWTFPTVDVTIPHSDYKRSQFGIFEASVSRHTPVSISSSDKFDYLVGKRIHLVMTPDHMLFDKRAGKEIAKECWELAEIMGGAPAGSGSTATTPLDRAMEILDGKTEAEFSQAVFKDNTVKKDGALMATLLAKTFIPAMTTAGKVVVDADGRYHKLG